MMTVQRLLLSLLLSLVSFAALAQTPTTFTYQGRLYNSDALANGSYVLRITAYGQASGGTELAPSITTTALSVVDGAFSTTLDFGPAVFLGGPVWLEIQVQAPASGFVMLSPRQPVTPSPYAINADKLNGLDAAQLTRASSNLVTFSTGTIRSGPTMVSAAPIMMGFGNSTVQVINGSGESTAPPEAGGFSFPIPASGTIHDLQISADLLVASVVSINATGLQYDFTVFRSPSVPNDGIDHLSAPYLTTPLTGSLRFGAPNTIITPGTFRSATNINIPGSLAVVAGDRIGIRIRTAPVTDPSAVDIEQLSFSATLTYTRNP